MKSTKDNWIKAFKKEYLSLGYCGDPECEYEGKDKCFHGTENDMIAFISQVEKDAIEKTNKRWRERIGEKAEKRLWTNTVANNMHVVKKYHQGINDLVSDLLEDKK